MATLSVRQLGRGVDLVLLTVTILLTLIGLGAVFSTSLNTATPSYAIFYRQAIFAAAGFALVIVFARLDYRSFGAAHWVLYGAALVSLVAVRLFGKTVNGTTGWFEVAGMQLQPVEFVKIIVCLVLAKYFSDHADETGSWKFVLMSGLIVAAPVLLVMIQPDFGSAMLMIAIWFGLLLAVPVRDGGCVFPGCGMPVNWCDLHHIIEWQSGGSTDITNMVCLCRRHHGITHSQGWHMEPTGPPGHFQWTTPTGKTLHSQHRRGSPVIDLTHQTRHRELS